MTGKVPRRDFLKTVRASVGLLACAAPAQTNPAAKPKPKAAPIAISGTAYTPVADYPIQPKRHSEVKIKDTFWNPKIKTNAEVTIPFEFQKLTESGSARGFGGGVLEAAILSLQTHADPKLQAQVDARIQALKQGSASGNRSFEIAAAYYYYWVIKNILV